MRIQPYVLALTHQLKTRIEDGPGAGEIEDLTSDYIDAPVIGSVELENHRVDLLGVVDLLGTGQYRRRFTGTGWSIEQLKRKTITCLYRSE